MWAILTYSTAGCLVIVFACAAIAFACVANEIVRRINKRNSEDQRWLEAANRDLDRMIRELDELGTSDRPTYTGFCDLNELRKKEYPE
ncbi:MAG: hypothetical protein IMY86_13790 [Chloroflexi bacterium]|nr:hypothetical protein [Chloroflexota bacterium]